MLSNSPEPVVPIKLFGGLGSDPVIAADRGGKVYSAFAIQLPSRLIGPAQKYLPGLPKEGPAAGAKIRIAITALPGLIRAGGTA